MATIIFDFDGTIANSFEYFIGFISKEAGLPPLSDEEKADLKGHSMTGVARDMGISWLRLPGLFFKGRRQMGPVIKHVDPFPGIPEVIKKLKAEGHELFILSTNSVHNVHNFLHKHDLYTYFLEIYGGVGMFGKAPALRRLLREQNLEMKDAIYIGDELRDVQAAKSIGLRVIAVTWGFARLRDLKAQKATRMADKPADIIKILEEL